MSIVAYTHLCRCTGLSLSRKHVTSSRTAPVNSCKQVKYNVSCWPGDGWRNGLGDGGKGLRSPGGGGRWGCKPKWRELPFWLVIHYMRSHPPLQYSHAREPQVIISAWWTPFWCTATPHGEGVKPAVRGCVVIISVLPCLDSVLLQCITACDKLHFVLLMYCYDTHHDLIK